MMGLDRVLIAYPTTAQALTHTPATGRTHPVPSQSDMRRTSH
jgi:hypothetical protein